MNKIKSDNSILRIIAALAVFLALGFESSFAFQTEEPQADSGQHAFTVGERLVFDVGYGFITAGEAVISIPEYDTVAAHQCFKVMFQVNSTPTFSWFFEVRDRYETYLDVDGIFPWRFEQHVKEGHYRRDFIADFDQIQPYCKNIRQAVSHPSESQRYHVGFLFCHGRSIFQTRKSGREFIFRISTKTQRMISTCNSSGGKRSKWKRVRSNASSLSRWRKRGDCLRAMGECLFGFPMTIGKFR